MPVEKVFVYGTLMKGERLHQFLDGSTFYGEGFVRASLFDTGLGYPAMAEASETMINRTLGEVYEVSAKVLKLLDRVEGVCGGDYTRERIMVSMVGARLQKPWVQHDRTQRDAMGVRLMSAWAYFQTDAQTRNLPSIETGDWRDWVQGFS